MWTHYEPTVSPNNLNLDEMFSFLQEERGNDNRGAGENKTLDEITDELNELNDLLTQDMVCVVKCFPTPIFFSWTISNLRREHSITKSSILVIITFWKLDRFF